jgi:hypothetical protein
MLTQSMVWVSTVLRPLVHRGTISILILVCLGLWLGTSGVAQAQTGTTLMVNGVTTPLTVASGATVTLAVSGGSGGVMDCLAVYPAGLPDLANGSYIDYRFLNGLKTAPVTGLTSASVSFPMPTPAGPYEFRWWKDCATLAVKSQVVTVGTGAVSFTVNGVTTPLTVAAGATVNVGVQNGPGNPLDCVALYPAGLPDVADGSYLNVFFLNGTKTAPSTGLTAATVAFPMPATLGPYEFRLWQNCATILAKSQVVTVQSGAATGDSNYVYDRLGRLIAVITASEMAIYRYDAVGNLLSIMRQSPAAVSILDFSPRSGSPGTSITILGTGYSSTASQNTVTFNGVTATILSAATTQLVVQVPSGGTLGSIAVSSPNGSATSTKLFGVSP